MTMIKVNIKEFEEKYAKGALIPTDILAYFTQCFLKGEEYADIRATVYDEMKIKDFYNHHPELRPQTDWEAIELSRNVIDLMKRHIKGDAIEEWELDDMQLKLTILLNGRKKKKEPNKPIDNLETLYDDIAWLKGLYIEKYKNKDK